MIIKCRPHRPLPPRGALWDPAAGCAAGSAVLVMGLQPVRPLLRTPRRGTPPPLGPGTQVRTGGCRRRPRPAGLPVLPGCRGPGAARLGWGPHPGCPRASAGPGPESGLALLGRRSPGPAPARALGSSLARRSLPPLPAEPGPAGLPGRGAADAARRGSGRLPGAEVPPAAGHAPGPQ